MIIRMWQIGLALLFVGSPFGAPSSRAQEEAAPGPSAVKEDTEREVEERDEAEDSDDDDNDDEVAHREREEGSERPAPNMWRPNSELPHPARDPAQQLHHIRMAMEHMQAAGLPQEAERLGMIAQKIESQVLGSKRREASEGHPEMKDITRVLRMMNRNLRELRQVVQQLHSRVEELESQQEHDE